MKEKKLLEFDPANATDEQIRAWLFAIIDQELDKPEGQEDTELIRECSECEMYLSGSENTLTEAQYLAGLAKIKQRAASMNEKKAHKPRVWRRLPALLAAVLVLIVLSAGAVAAVNGSPAWEFITTNIQEILGMGPGDTLESDKVTLVKGDLVAEYDSVEEALKAGGFEGILYPTELPEGVKVKRIVQTNDGDEAKYCLTLILNSETKSCRIYNFEKYSSNHLNTNETIIINNREYTIIAHTDAGYYQAIFGYNGFQYIYTDTNYDDLLNTLNSFEELQ